MVLLAEARRREEAALVEQQLRWRRELVEAQETLGPEVWREVGEGGEFVEEGEQRTQAGRG